MFELPPLPFDEGALEPVISRAALRLHHGKHHQAYINATNDLLVKAGRTPESLEAVVTEAADDDGPRTLFNNAAQAWNHAFFWASMSPSRETPEADLTAAIDLEFGGLEDLQAAFIEKGKHHFGSGWLWLAATKGGIDLVATHDAADLLSRSGLTPLLVCDLWEHAYYLDHKNDREAYLKAWFQALPNWQFAGRQFAAAHGEGPSWRHPRPTAPVEGTSDPAAR